MYLCFFQLLIHHSFIHPSTLYCCPHTASWRRNKSNQMANTGVWGRHGCNLSYLLGVIEAKVSTTFVYSNQLFPDVCPEWPQYQDSSLFLGHIRQTSRYEGFMSKLTIFSRFTERTRAHHAFWPVSQRQTAAQGGGTVEVSRVAGRPDAVGAGDPGGARGYGSDYHKWNTFGRRVSGTNRKYSRRTRTHTNTHSPHLSKPTLPPLFWWLSEIVNCHGSTTVTRINIVWLHPLNASICCIFQPGIQQL